MWLSNQSRLNKKSMLVKLLAPLYGLVLLSGCTVEPLNATRPDSKISSGDHSNSIGNILAATTVNPVETRPAQQVRNKLLFAMNGGQLQPGGQYNVALDITTKSYNLSIEKGSLAPTSAQVTITASYQLLERASSKVLATGKRKALASFDRTSQSFANERAERDAENRAAKEVAQQIKHAIAQSLADL